MRHRNDVVLAPGDELTVTLQDDGHGYVDLAYGDQAVRVIGRSPLVLTTDACPQRSAHLVRPHEAVDWTERERVVGVPVAARLVDRRFRFLDRPFPSGWGLAWGLVQPFLQERPDVR